MKPYGKELILDIHECNPSTFTRASLKKYFKELCKLIDMERCDLHFWDYQGDTDGYEKAENHLKGTSAIQFITTSNITIHTLDILERVYVNIFSCRDFSGPKVEMFTRNWFGGRIVHTEVIDRK